MLVMDATASKYEPLTDQQRAVLEFERLKWKYAGRKEAVIRETLGLSATRYYQVLNTVLAMPAAEVYDAQLVRRIRSIRDGRRDYRHGHRPAAGVR